MTGGPFEPQVTGEAPDELPFDTLVGLRSEDLGPRERQTLVFALGTGAFSADHTAARAVAGAIAALPNPASSLHAGDVLERLAIRRHRRVLLRQVAGVALVAAALGLLGLAWHLSASPPPPPGTVTFEAQASISGVQHPIAHGAALTTASPLNLAVTTATQGALFVTERYGYDTVRPIAPLSGRWEVEPGLHPVATSLLPPQAPQAVLYEAWLCPTGATSWSARTCRRDRLLVEWMPDPAHATLD